MIKGRGEEENMEQKNDLPDSNPIIHYENDEMFYMIISGVFPASIYTVLKGHFNLQLYYSYDLFEDIGYIIVSDNDEILIRLKSPKLSYCSGRGMTVMQKAVSNQRQIDTWLKLLAENLEFTANAYTGKELKIEVKYFLIYKERMYFESIDRDEHCAYIHPYVKKYYPDDYEEIKRLKELEGFTVAVDIFERRLRNQFESHGINYLRLKEEEI